MSGGEPSNALIFIHGNFVETSLFKVLLANDTVQLVGTQAAKFVYSIDHHLGHQPTPSMQQSRPAREFLPGVCMMPEPKVFSHY